MNDCVSVHESKLNAKLQYSMLASIYDGYADNHYIELYPVKQFIDILYTIKSKGDKIYTIFSKLSPNETIDNKTTKLYTYELYKLLDYYILVYTEETNINIFTITEKSASDLYNKLSWNSNLLYGHKWKIHNLEMFNKILNTSNTSKEDTNYTINNQNENVVYIVQAPSSNPEVYQSKIEQICQQQNKIFPEDYTINTKYIITDNYTMDVIVDICFRILYLSSLELSMENDIRKQLRLDNNKPLFSKIETTPNNNKVKIKINKKDWDIKDTHFIIG